MPGKNSVVILSLRRILTFNSLINLHKMGYQLNRKLL